jgi:hypothetical protein
MKPRPRCVEREVAELLSNIYSKHGYSPVKRIPILGRTGPDIEINETNLVVDAKSRIAVPQSHMLGRGERGIFGDYLGVRLCELDRRDFKSRIIRPSLLAWDWLMHMDEWRRMYLPNGISAVVLHRPKTRIANATFIIKTEDWSKLCKIINKMP